MSGGGAHIALEAAYRTETRRVLATLVRLLGGFEAAEEALHEAFAAAAHRWPHEGVPANPYAWLVSAGRFKMIDRWRRLGRLEGALADLAAVADLAEIPSQPDEIQDDELRLIFVCCHPALAPDARIALTLREVCGLTTEEIARAYLAATPAIAQRIVRAKGKIRDAGLAYEVPDRAERPARLESVLQVIYLIFNEGYAATQGPDLIRPDLCAEAVRLGRLLVELTDEPEALGLLALMRLHDSRRAARADAAGRLVLLEDQDRSLWDCAAIAEARGLIERACAAGRIGPYGLQAMLAAAHAEAPTFEATDWARIVTLFDILLQIAPSPVVALNRAVAIGQRDGPQAGLSQIEAAMASGGLDGYHLAHAAVGDMQRRLGRTQQAAAAYRRALDLARQSPERRFLQERLDQLGAGAPDADPPPEPTT